MIRHDIILACLAITVICCWVGAVGAWRMREPTQSLHYLSLPTGLGAAFLTVAVVLKSGWGETAAKMIAIFLIFVATNSVGTHATARAIRVRKLGHWEPRKKDGVEFIREDSNP